VIGIVYVKSNDTTDEVLA